MRPFTPEEIRIHKEVSIALFLMERREYFRLTGSDSFADWLYTRAYCVPLPNVQAFLRRVLDDSELCSLAWQMAVKSAGNYGPTKHQLKSAVKEVNRNIPKWLKEGEACQKAFQEGMANGDVIVNVDIIK